MPLVLPAGDPDAQRRAAGVLARGDLVALPTETVYGLAADATDPEAVARIYEIKGRPSFNPLIVHCVDVDEARAHGSIDARAEALAERFWPGPLTIVAPRRTESRIADLVAAGLDTVALRVPDAPAARAVIALLGRPLAAPSANRSGRITATSAADVVEEFGEGVPLILDGGRCRIGLESAIVALLPGEAPRLLRAGGVPAEDVEAVLGTALRAPGAGVEAPGMLASHYAPSARLRLDARDVRQGEALLAFGAPVEADTVLNLSEGGDLREAAANLFSHLRALDRESERIAVMPVPEEGLGIAINDRLKRAALREGGEGGGT